MRTEPHFWLQKNSYWSGRGSKALRAPLLRNTPWRQEFIGYARAQPKVSYLHLTGEDQRSARDEHLEAGFRDVIYIPPNERHQLKSVGEDPL